jgi:hypothetical protein
VSRSLSLARTRRIARQAMTAFVAAFGAEFVTAFWLGVTLVTFEGSLYVSLCVSLRRQVQDHHTGVRQWLRLP